MAKSTTVTLGLAAIGLVVVALLGYGVVALTTERNLLSSVPEDAGMRLAPGAGDRSMRKPGDKPVVISVGPDGQAVIKSRGDAPAAPSVSSGSMQHTRNSRNEDD